MAAKPVIVILGNCQAQMLEGIVSSGVPDCEVVRCPLVFELTEADRQKLADLLGRADFIFAQRVSQDYHLDWVRPANLKAAYPGKVTVWPVIYFDGYFPDVQYIYTKDYGKLQGPLDDYHMMRLFEAHKAGLSPQAAVEKLVSDARPAGESVEKSLDQLRSREGDVDVTISDYLAEVVRERRAFYTPNHPYTFVLIEMAARLAGHAGLQFDRERAETFGYNLDKIYIPVYPSVLQRPDMQFSDGDTFKGLEVASVEDRSVALGGEKRYSLLALAEAFYRVYDKAFAAR